MTYADIASLLGNLFHAELWPTILQYTILLSPIALAGIMARLFWDIWVRYVRLKNFLNMKYALLELRLPKDTWKSPLAMETVLQAIHNTSDGNWYGQYWKGDTRPWYSLEIISIEGQVKFMIWSEDRRKQNLMSALYAQYPGIEITERADYAKEVQFDPKIWKVWAAEFEFTKPDPYPIKTYVDYGLDKDPKEEFKIDPITHVIEWLGSLRPNEQAWFQFVVRAHKKEQHKKGTLWGKTDRWKDLAQEEINKILIRDKKTKVAGEVNPDTGFAKLPTISHGEQEVVKALERSLTKMPFDVCIRTLYIAKKESFDTPFGIGGVISCLKQFSTEHLNGFKPSGKWTSKVSDYPWQDYRNMRRNYISKAALKAYRRRSAFYPPFQNSKVVVLNTEELATLYHFPGTVAATPGLERVPSKKAEAPSNLPV